MYGFTVNQLSQLACTIETPVGRNSIKATFKGSDSNGPTIALRADFDVPPVQELNDVPYCSKNKGCAHTYGHDGHTATLLGVTEIVHEYRHLLRGNVVLIFQYGEEIMPGGSQEMTDDGCLQNVDKIYGTYLWNGYPSGTIYSRPEAIMASPGEFSVTIYGKGGHGAKPHETIDPIVIMAEFTLSAQEIVFRTVDPVKEAVLTFGMIQAGSTDNVIPDTALCKGTVRTFDTKLQSHIQNKMNKLLQSLSLSNDTTYELEYIKGYLPVHNHQRSYDVVKQATNDLHLRSNESDLMMIGEDFSYYPKVRPSVFFLTGCGNKNKGITAPHHNPHFDIGKSSLKYAASELLKILETENVF